MKNLKIHLGCLAVFALLFTSCSKDESGVLNSDSETATLSFGAIVNDLVNNRAATKQAVGTLPDCNNNATADYVEIVLVRVNNDGSTTNAVGSSGTPYRVNLVAGEIFTEEDAALELTPGNYRLEHFAVYDEVEGDDDLIWLAPRVGSDLSNYIDNALPLDIDLRAGVKKYVDVSVLCFDNREVNQYGYLFFELDTNVALTYCFFANYCNDEGVHYPAQYSISIWSGINATGVPLYTNEVNNTGVHENGDFYATPLCFALPDNDDLDEEYLYYEMTLLDWEDNYGDVDQVIISGTITKRDIIENFGNNENDNVEYEHVRFCGEDDGEPVGDRDNDNIPDNVDACPDEAGPASNNGCPESSECNPEDPAADCDGDGVSNRCDTDNPNYDSFDCDNDNIVNAEDDCPTEAGVSGPDGENGCPEDTNGQTCTGLPEICDLEFGNLPADCYLAALEGANAEGYVLVTGPGDIDLIQSILGEDWGDVTVSISNSGTLTVSIDAGLPSDRITAFEVAVVLSENGEMSSTCRESQCDSTLEDVVGDQPAINLTFDAIDYSYPFYLKVNCVICEVPVLED